MLALLVRFLMQKCNYRTLRQHLRPKTDADVLRADTPSSRSEDYTTIGNAVGRAKNTVMRYVDALAEKGLVSTEPTSVLTRSGIKKNGNLRYTILPIHEAIEIFHARQLSAVERATERQQIQRKLSAMDMLPGA